MIVEEGKLYLCVELSGDYYPHETSTRFDIRWYRKDDFNSHIVNIQSMRMDSYCN